MIIGTICGFIFILIQLILIIDFAHRFILKTLFFSNKIFHILFEKKKKFFKQTYVQNQ